MSLLAVRDDTSPAYLLRASRRGGRTGAARATAESAPRKLLRIRRRIRRERLKLRNVIESLQHRRTHGRQFNLATGKARELAPTKRLG